MAQQRLFDPSNVNLRQFQPVALAQGGAAAYAQARGMEYNPEVGAQTTYNPVSQLAQKAHIDANMGVTPLSPAGRSSYGAFIAANNDQFEHMTKPVEHGGMGLQYEVTDEDPYGSVHEMRADVEQNRRIKVLRTTPGLHDTLSDEDNNRFRAVHDVMGHAATGRSFSRDGEEAAYLHHKQLFPPEAHAALAVETRFQNSNLIWGGNGFMDKQHAFDAPDWSTSDTGMPPAPQRKIKSHGTQQAMPW